MPTTLPPPTVAWNSWNLGSGSAAAAGPLFSLAGGSRPWPSPALPHPQHPRLAPIPLSSLYFFGGGVCVWRPGKAPALCVVWDGGSGPLPFRCRRYAANSMGCSLITYLITEECQQCVCFGKGAGGGCAGATSHSAASHQKVAVGGESWGCPGRFPPLLPWGEGVSFGLLAEGAGRWLSSSPAPGK